MKPMQPLKAVAKAKAPPKEMKVNPDMGVETEEEAEDPDTGTEVEMTTDQVEGQDAGIIDQPEDPGSQPVDTGDPTVPAVSLCICSVLW